MSLFAYMKDIVEDSIDSLETACKLAIAGNVIDLGAQAEYGINKLKIRIRFFD
jgi:uncharacterized protein with ATP-grasp and redox domains